MIKLKRRIGSAVLAVMMLLSLMPLTALAASTEITDVSSLKAAITAANNGDTITIPAGEYDVGDYYIDKQVNLVGAEGENKTIIKGSIFLTQTVGDMSISNLTMQGSGTHVALNIQGHSNDNTQVLSGATITIDNCTFQDYSYTIGLNSRTSNCKLVIKNSEFINTGCAAAVQTANGNTVTFENTTVNSGFAVQSFGNDYNGFYYDADAYLTQSPDLDATKTPITFITSVETADYANIVSNAANNAVIMFTGGTYDIGSLNVNKAVNIVGAGAGKTILNGSIAYTSNADTADVTISGLTLKATADQYNSGVNFSALTNSDISVTDCAFEGYQFGIGVNSNATGNSLTVSDSSFVNTGCAAGVKQGSANNNVEFTNVDTNGGYAIQSFASGSDGYAFNGYYDSYEKYTEDLSDGKLDTPDFNAITTPGQIVSPSMDLQAAIDAAKDGDTIILAPGTYDGNITIDGKSITILGANAGVSGTSDNRGAESVITGQVLVNGKTTDTSATDITFDGLKFTGNGSISTRMGANYYGVNLTVQNCVADKLNNTFVYTRGVTGNGQNLDRLHGTITIKDNLVSNITGENNSAFNLWYASKHVITGNYVEGIPYNAFNLNATSGPVVFTNNTIKDIGQSGFQIANSAADDVNVEIKDNSFEEIGNSAIRLYGDIASNLEITGNTVEGDCIAINLADAKNVTDAIISGNTQNGNPVGVTGSVDDLFLVTVIDRDNIIDRANITDGTGYKLPDAPSRAGYSFRGWYGNGHLYAAGDVVTITEDTTFVAQWSDNTPYYTITVKDAENGTVTCYAKSAAKGADVTLNVKADVGYQLDKLTVTDASGNVIDVEKVNNTTYTFVMPGSKVTVEAVFAPTTVEPSDLPFTDVSTSDWFYGAVKFVYENGLMDGVGNNLFAPNATLNRAMAVTILYRLEGSPAVTTDAGFNDVAAGTWYTDAVNWAAANNIVNGVEGNNFDPTGSLTREQMATVLYRYAQYKGADVSASGDLSGFVDSANVSSWAADAVKWAVGSGLVNGVEGNALAPQGTSTRAQAATVLMRFVG